MALMSVNDKCLAVASKIQIDLYDYSNHHIIDISSNIKQDDLQISDIIISSDNKYLAAITSSSKCLFVYEIDSGNRKVFQLPRSASKIRFTVNNTQILVADKSGDVLIYNISNDVDCGTKLLGHLSLLLDILQSDDEKYIITTDRDEKIKVSHYPNTYNIHTYCLGHKEFVNHIELLPHDNKYLLSASGDGTVNIWDYKQGKMCHSIDSYTDINDPELKNHFIKTMDLDGVEVNALPIVHLTTTIVNENTSLIAVSVYTFKKLLVYSVHNDKNNFTHKLETTLDIESFPSSIQFHNKKLFIYNEANSNVTIYDILHLNNTVSLKLIKQENMFENVLTDNCTNTDVDYKKESIKVLYKRKFDNVQEYQERKKQRLEKSAIKENE